MALTVGASQAQQAPSSPEPSTPGRGEAMLMLDYQVVPVPGARSIDLMGLHLLNRMNDWLYLGVGAYAPLVKGEYGGFMAVDVTAHVQRRLWGNLFADAGVALGGGGGGKSVQQSRVLSGTGGFAKVYAGLGYAFDDFSVGLNVSRVKFTDSAIDHSQLNAYVQIPFSYAIGPYASAGTTLPAGVGPSVRGADAQPGENMLSLGLDNYKQIDPEGSNKGTVNVADLQFSHFMSKDAYWFLSVGVGYHGLPLYNQLLGGLGYRVRLSPRVNLYGQVALGSGGYAPDTIDTGPGLLIHPKVSAEFMLDKNLGLALTAGYLFAPKGSSKNYTLGASLNYHLFAGGGGDGGLYRGYRFSVFQQTETNLGYKDQDRSDLKLLSLQADALVGDHVYIPLQVSVATNAYLGYPGYGELLAGAGVQSRFDEGDRVRWFGQVMVGTNVHGAILKTGVGVNIGLSERLALYATAGQTFGKDKFRADQVGLGLSYRFSLP